MRIMYTVSLANGGSIQLHDDRGPHGSGLSISVYGPRGTDTVAIHLSIESQAEADEIVRAVSMWASPGVLV